MRSRRGAIAVAALAMFGAACAGGGGGDKPRSGDPVAGAPLFVQYCSACHGADGEGTDQGPPLVHALYRRGHHPDDVIALAVRTGVRAHHWDFGPMLPVTGPSDDDIADIIAHIRSLQQAAGIE